MKTADNKIFVALATTNIVAFIMIFILVWLLWESYKGTQETPIVATEDALVAKAIAEEPTTQTLADKNQQMRDQNKSLLKQKILSTFELVVQEVKAAELDMSVFARGDSGKAIAQTVNQGVAYNTKQDIDGNETNADVGMSDEAYISAFNQLDKQAPTKRQYTREQVSTVQVIASLETDALAKNRFNKIDVSQHQSKKVLTQKLVAIVSNTQPEQKSSSNSAASTPPAWKDYLHSLKSAEAERKNEMRTIKVKQGDTLWRIAVRAYGSGFLYTKIFEANPHLINPASIITGETLRVPL